MDILEGRTAVGVARDTPHDIAVLSLDLRLGKCHVLDGRADDHIEEAISVYLRGL